MAITTQRLTNGNLYIDGGNFAGTIQEITTPEINAEMTEYEALGMFGKSEFSSGFQTMEATVMLNAPTSNAKKLLSDINTARQMQVRGSMDELTSQGLSRRISYVLNMTATPKRIPSNQFQQNTAVTEEIPLNVTAVELIIDGEQIYKVDVLANIYIVDGVDLLADYRANLGI